MALHSTIFVAYNTSTQTDPLPDKPDPNTTVTIPYGLFDRLMTESTQYQILLQNLNLKSDRTLPLHEVLQKIVDNFEKPKKEYKNEETMTGK